MAATRRAKTSPPFDLLLPRGLFKDRCAALPAVGRRGPFVQLDEPTALRAASLKGVRGLYAFAPFECRVPAPGVEELLLESQATIDERTARCFPGVRNLALHVREGVELAWFTRAPLEGLSITDRSLSDPRVLRSAPLRRLSLRWTGLPLSHLPPTLEELALAPWAPLRAGALAPVWSLPRLASLRLINVRLGTLAAAAKAPALTALHVQSVGSFRGIARLGRLRELGAFGVTCPPVAELAEAASLRVLSLRSKRPPSDLEALGRLTALESLSLDFGDIHGWGDVASLAFLRALPGLKTLRIVGVNLLDRDVTPIRDLPRLQRLELAGVFGRGAGALPRSRRGRKTEIRNFVAPARRPPLTPRRIAGRWTIFEDVAGLLNAPNNHDAEARVRRRLRTQEPLLLRRLEFDSEGDSFCATAATQADAKKLARLIRSMVRDARRSR